MNKKEIEAIILKAVGNPESGLLVENVSSMAQALFKALNPEEVEPKEERIIKPKETR
jgi:hypothetical protein